MNQKFTTEVKDVDQKTQDLMNKPPLDPNGFDEGEEEFIKSIMEHVFDPSDPMDLMKPSTLIKQEVYASVDEMAQGRADQIAVNFCSKLRELRDLMELSGGDKLYIEPTYQAKALVADLKYRKEEFENEYGDLFLI
jgi:hypothetical protein